MKHKFKLQTKASMRTDVERPKVKDGLTCTTRGVTCWPSISAHKPLRPYNYLLFIKYMIK